MFAERKPGGAWRSGLAVRPHLSVEQRGEPLCPRQWLLRWSAVRERQAEIRVRELPHRVRIVAYRLWSTTRSYCQSVRWTARVMSYRDLV